MERARRQMGGPRTRRAALAAGALAVAAPAQAQPAAEAAFPGENGRISFVTYSVDPDDPYGGRLGTYEIDTIDVGGGDIPTEGLDPETIVDGIDQPSSAPTWSPDGSRLVFSRYRDFYGYGGIPTSQVFMADAATGEVSHIINGRIDPSFDPSGEWITFSSGKRIEAVRPDGAGLHTLFTAPRRIRRFQHPRWAPDGERIIVEAKGKKARKSGIWSFRSDGSERSQITSNRQDREPEYSPDGQSIIFTRRQDHVIIARFDGSRARKLVSQTQTGWWISGAVFAPAGDRVVVAGAQSDKYSSCANLQTLPVSLRSPYKSIGCNYYSYALLPGWQPLSAATSGP